MDFWNSFIAESLQSPWMIRPLSLGATPSLQLDTKKVFVIEEGLPDSAYEMLSKMVLALKYDPSEVTFLNASVSDAESLQDVSEGKNILFFGKDFPGTFSENRNWFGHQVMKTHSLKDLLAQPNLKKETWQHLKFYASLK